MSVKGIVGRPKGGIQLWSDGGRWTKSSYSISSVSQARDMMMYYLWCPVPLAARSKSLPTPPPAPITIQERPSPAGGFSIQASPVSNAHKASCQSLTRQSVQFSVIHLVSLHTSRSLSLQSSPRGPFHQTDKTAPRGLKHLFSVEMVVCVKCSIYYYIMHYAGAISRKRLNNVSSELRFSFPVTAVWKVERTSIVESDVVKWPIVSLTLPDSHFHATCIRNQGRQTNKPNTVSFFFWCTNANQDRASSKCFT